MAAATPSSTAALPPSVARTIPGLSTSSQAKAAPGSKRSRKKKTGAAGAVEESPLVADSVTLGAALRESAPTPNELAQQPAGGLGLELDMGPLATHSHTHVHTGATATNGHSAGVDLPSKPVSPVNQVVKRIKAMKKKIQRIDGYQTGGQVLNEDQKRAIATVPALQSTVKELQDLLQILEDDEKADEVRIQSVRAEEETKIQARVEVAVALQKKTSETDITLLLQFLHLYSIVNSISGGGIQGFAPPPVPAILENATAQETAAIHSLFNELANGPIAGGGEDAINRIRSLREGNDTEVLPTVPYFRVKELILGLTASPAEVEAASKEVDDSDRSDISDLPATGPRFMQPSELPPVGSDAAALESIDTSTPTPAAATKQASQAVGNESWAEATEGGGVDAADNKLDWAQDVESGAGLPAIDAFGGDASGVDLAAVESSGALARDPDGFQDTRGGRGGSLRGRGGRGGRGGFRGDGAFRGDGGFRGGGGDRGGFRGGPSRGGGRADTGDNWRVPREGGPPRDGNFQGSRGRGEGGRGGRGGPPGRGAPRGAPAQQPVE